MLEELQKQIAAAVPEEYRSLVRVFPAVAHAEGDYATNIAMQLAGKLHQSPMAIAEEISKKIKSEMIASVAVAAPGYINVRISDNYILKNIEQTPLRQGSAGRGKNLTYMVEYGHPNPFKILHIGHLRNFCLGESLCRLLEWDGIMVIRTNYQGDVGMHVAKNIWAFRKAVNSDPTLIASLQKKSIDDRVHALATWYVEGAKAFEEDSAIQEEIKAVNTAIYEKSDPQVNELWHMGVAWSLEKFHAIYKRLGTHFEREYLESETLEGARTFVDEALRQGILERSEGAVVFKGAQYGLDTRVFQNSQGHLTYEGKELGLAHKEFTDFGVIDRCIHNVAVEQKSFFAVTFKVEELLWPELIKGKQYHHAYEFVGLTTGKMSSRKGQVIAGETILNEAHAKIAEIVRTSKMMLDDAAIDTIALAAVKYAYLKMSYNTYLAFDMDTSVSFDGDSGPYLLYTYARAQSVLQKAEKKATFQVDSFENDDERTLGLLLAQYTDAVERAVAEYAPHHVALYLNTLAQAFNAFYGKHKIGDNERRLALTAKVAATLKEGSYLLGIETVERM